MEADDDCPSRFVSYRDAGVKIPVGHHPGVEQLAGHFLRQCHQRDAHLISYDADRHLVLKLVACASPTTPMETDCSRHTRGNGTLSHRNSAILEFLVINFADA